MVKNALASHDRSGVGEEKIEWKIRINHKVLHYPRLDTVIMVAETLKKTGPCTKSGLSRNLKPKVMWSTLTTILDYFDTMGFTVKDRMGKIVWIYNPDMVKKYARREDLKWEPK